jgi:hypothetical protein
VALWPSAAAWQGAGGAGAQFYNSSVARQGDLGSKLPKGPAQARRPALAPQALKSLGAAG